MLAQAQLTRLVGAEHEPHWKIQHTACSKETPKNRVVQQNRRKISHPSSLPEVQDNHNILFDLPAEIRTSKMTFLWSGWTRSNFFQKKSPRDHLASPDALKA